MTGPRAVIAIATILGATLAGCSEKDPVPRVEPSSSASSGSPSGSPSASPSADPMTPEETVRAWVEAQNEAMITGRMAPIRALSSKHCVTCDQFIDPIVKVHEAGGEFRTTGWIVRGTHVRHSKDSNRVVDAAVTFAGGTTIRKRGGQPVSYGRENHLLVFRLITDGPGWLVKFVGFLS